jgi:cytochrome P450
VIDLLDPELHASGDGVRVLRELREQEPIAWREGRRGRGYWAVTGHPELVTIAKDAESFSSYWGTRPEAARPPDAERPLHNLDPPEHAIARKAAAALFRRDLGPIIDAVVHDAVEGFHGGDALALAHAVPSRIFAAWMGLGIDAGPDLDRLVRNVHDEGAALLDSFSDAARARAKRATEDLAAFVRMGSASPFAPLFALAGMPTVIDAIANGIVLRETDIEEILRFASPILQFARYATRGVGKIRAGDQVVLWFCSANRDARVFANADAFVADRTPNPHVAFGVGPHQCIGSVLGRQILRTFFAAWRSKGAYQVESVRRPSSYMNGFKEVDVSFTTSCSSSRP